MLLLDPVDGLFGQVFGKVIARVTGRLYRLGVIEKSRTVLIRLATHKAIKVVEAIRGGPVGKWPARPGFPYRCVVPLSKCCRRIALELEHLGDGGSASGNDACVAGVGLNSNLRDGTVAYPVVITSCEKRRTCC